MISKSIQDALEAYHKALRHVQVDCLVGGSCGLLLHGLRLSSEPRDLDLYIDERFVPIVSQCLSGYAVDQVHYSETGMYRSYLSHYNIEEVLVELVGSFLITVEGTSYQVKVSDSMKHFCTRIEMGQEEICVMPLAHELVFNVLRNRPDRYLPIAEKMCSDYVLHLPAFMEILKRNQFNETYIRKFCELLKYNLPERDYKHVT